MIDIRKLSVVELQVVPPILFVKHNISVKQFAKSYYLSIFSIIFASPFIT